MVKFYRPNTTMSFLLIVVLFISTANSQTAENLFDNYTKWGITSSLNNFKEGEVTSTRNDNLSVEIFSNKRASLGINYNFYQKNNWNFRAALELQWFGNAGGYSILAEENISNSNLGLFYETENDKLAYLPITAEYFLLTKGKLKFSLGTGIGFTFYEFLGTEELITEVNDIRLLTLKYSSNEKQFYTSGHLEGNLYLSTKQLLFQASLVYKKSFKSFRTGTYEFTNLEVSPDTRGTIDQSGDFFGVGLSIYFKKKKVK